MKVNFMVRAAFVFVLMMCSLGVGAQETHKRTEHFDQQKTQWIAKVLTTIETVKPGMTRADLLKIFTTEGGLSTRYQRTYVFKECPYIKVDVAFVRSTNESVVSPESPSDVIAKISQPYLQFFIAD